MCYEIRLNPKNNVSENVHYKHRQSMFIIYCGDAHILKRLFKDLI